jgi:6-phosphogluconolactonase
MIALKRVALICVSLMLAGLAGCSSSSTHIAYVTLPTSNSIAAFRVSNHSGKFTSVVGSPFAAGNSPSSIVLDPANKFAHAANQTGDDISLFKIDHSTGELSEIMPRTPAGISPSALAMDSAGTFLFAANVSSSNISVYSINAGTGVLTEVSGSPFSVVPGASPVALTVSPSGKYLYVASSTLGLVFGYSIGSGGSLQQLSGSPFPVGSGPFSLAIDPGEHFVYVANSLSNSSSVSGTISVLSIDATTGTLTSLPNSPFTAGTNPVSLAIDSAGKFLYVANLGGNNVSAFSLDSTTGVPTELTTPKSPFAAGTRPVFATIDSTGKFLYVANENSRDISGFTIDSSTGGLTNASIAASVGSAPTSIATTK